MTFKRLFFFLPVLLVLVIGGFFLWGLNPDRDPQAIPSALIGKPVPKFTLPELAGSGVPGLDEEAFENLDGPVLVNVFASWCLPCRAEHPILIRFQQEEGVRLFGINYQNKVEDAVPWLEELGNPYERIGYDIEGRAGIDWGISGVPETFVVDGNGVVTYRHVGPIVEAEDQQALRRALAKAREGGA